MVSGKTVDFYEKADWRTTFFKQKNTANKQSNFNNVLGSFVSVAWLPQFLMNTRICHFTSKFFCLITTKLFCNNLLQTAQSFWQLYTGSFQL